MSFFGKVYSVINSKDENFEGFLRSAGVPEDKLSAGAAQNSTIKIVQNGDTYTLTQSGASGDKEVSFKSGVEFEDISGQEKVPVKNTITVAGNTVTQVIKSPIGTATFKREYNGDDLVVTITGSNFDGVAKRYYKA